MLSADVFSNYVRDALAHLYDRPYLRSHPLTSVLGGERPISEDALRRLLLDAVESLRPPEPCPPSSPAWRRYRYLKLRYIEGATPEQTAHELQISVRQSQRERDRALNDVAVVLWEHYRSRANSRRSEASRPTIEAIAIPAAGYAPDRMMERFTASEALQDELFKVGALPSTEPIGLSIVIQDALDVVARLVEERGAHVEVAFPEELPPVCVHRLVLRQVLIDLLESAIESRTRARIQVAADVVAARVRLDVSVPRAGAATVAPPTDVEARLIATGKLIEFQGGRLRIDQSANVAFHASVMLPLTRTRTLLVIDDNPDVAFLFSRMLRDHAYRVVQASTSATALQLVREACPDAITLDVLMPSQDGWDLLRMLRGDPDTRHIPVILCSVLPERSLALSLGVAEFLNKPVSREALLAALERCIPSSRTG